MVRRRLECHWSISFHPLFNWSSLELLFMLLIAQKPSSQFCHGLKVRNSFLRFMKWYVVLCTSHCHEHLGPFIFDFHWDLVEIDPIYVCDTKFVCFNSHWLRCFVVIDTWIRDVWSRSYKLVWLIFDFQDFVLDLGLSYECCSLPRMLSMLL